MYVLAAPGTVCRGCGRIMSSPENREAHEASRHPYLGYKTCPICVEPTVFRCPSIGQLAIHLGMHHLPLKCIMCDRIITTMSELVAHKALTLIKWSTGSSSIVSASDSRITPHGRPAVILQRSSFELRRRHSSASMAGMTAVARLAAQTERVKDRVPQLMAPFLTSVAPALVRPPSMKAEYQQLRHQHRDVSTAGSCKDNCTQAQDGVISKSSKPAAQVSKQETPELQGIMRNVYSNSDPTRRVRFSDSPAAPIPEVDVLPGSTLLDRVAATVVNTISLAALDLAVGTMAGRAVVVAPALTPAVSDYFDSGCRQTAGQAFMMGGRTVVVMPTQASTEAPVSTESCKSLAPTKTSTTLAMIVTSAQTSKQSNALELESMTSNDSCLNGSDEMVTAPSKWNITSTILEVDEENDELAQNKSNNYNSDSQDLQETGELMVTANTTLESPKFN